MAYLVNFLLGVAASYAVKVIDRIIERKKEKKGHSGKR